MPKVKERKLCNKQDTPLLTTDKTKNGKKEMERQIENKKNKLHSFEEPNNKRGSEIQRPEGLCSIQEMTVELKERTKEDELMRSSRKETSSTKIRKTSKLKKEVDELIEKEIQKCCLTGISIIEQSLAELNDAIAKMGDYKKQSSKNVIQRNQKLITLTKDGNWTISLLW
ncbi:uncharacterized protein LOC124554669 isoform X1 [Schistocerca americana]|uniref:uncharacterized protein LOC124554669 isoform X1 n=1 Tax=Schistocerca americana TaxID=7009 RepID=UPI001F4F4D63|nr:uncharacterized protein LOC124554669 isoform X1 [Schistocerca americana]